MYIMEAICVKLDKQLLRNIDENMKECHYTTRTDFVREAIRDKLRELEKEKAIKKLEQYFGSAKMKISDEEHEKIREKVAREYAKKFGISLE